MMEGSQADLFGRAEPIGYPHDPGSRSAPTSREAARAIAPHANTLRRAVLERYLAVYPRGLAADQVAELLRASILSVRPRVTELRRQGLLEPTTTRHTNESGMSAASLRATRLALQDQTP